MTAASWQTRMVGMDGAIVTVEVPLNVNPDAVLAAHYANRHHALTADPWFGPADVATVIAAFVDRRPAAIDRMFRMPDAAADAVIRFVFHHHLIRQEGQRVTLTRNGRRYLRTYGGTQ